MERYRIIAPDGRAVSYLKRGGCGVSVYMPGSHYWPPRRGLTPLHSIKMEGASAYPEKIARGWLTSLNKDGQTGYRMEKIDV